MSKKIYEESNIQDIASAIRAKNGTQNTYTTGQMAEAIRNIETQPDLEELSASENGTYTPSSGKDGFSRVNVNVQSGGGSAILVQKMITSNGTYNALLDDDADGYSEVLVSVSGGGTASFDNILIGSSVPDASVGTPGDAYIQAFTNRVDGRAYHKIIAYFYKTSQNTWAKFPDGTFPYPRISLRIVTHSTGGNDASIDIYVNQTFIRNILYDTVTQVSAHSFDDLLNLFVGYNTSASVAPDGIGRNGWCIYAPNNGSAIYNGEIIAANSLIQNWNYSIPVDFTIEV